MNKRQITPELLNRLFFSPSFLRRVESSGKLSTDVFMEASDKEVDEWLVEGARVEGRIHSQTKGGYLIRGFRGVIAGLAVTFIAMLTAIVYSPLFREAVGPGTQWQIGSESFGSLAPFLMFFIVLGLPSIAAALLVARLSNNRLSMWTGLFGLTLGCWWHIHLSILSATVLQASMYQGGLASAERLDGPRITRWFINIEYDLLINGGSLFGIIMFLLPLICAVIAVWTMNFWVKCWTEGC